MQNMDSFFSSTSGQLLGDENVAKFGRLSRSKWIKNEEFQFIVRNISKLAPKTSFFNLVVRKSSLYFSRDVSIGYDFANNKIVRIQNNCSLI